MHNFLSDWFYKTLFFLSLARIDLFVNSSLGIFVDFCALT